MLLAALVHTYLSVLREGMPHLLFWQADACSVCHGPGAPGPRLVAVGQLLAAGAMSSGSPLLAAAVADAVRHVLFASVCRTASVDEQSATAAGVPLHHGISCLSVACDSCGSMSSGWTGGLEPTMRQVQPEIQLTRVATNLIVGSHPWLRVHWAGTSTMASFEVLEAWHLTASEHVALIRDVLIPLAQLHASTDLACSG